MSEIRFEGPPPPASPRARANVEVADALRSRPGEWAVIKALGTSQAARSSANHINYGGLHAFLPAGAFEAVARHVDGEHRVYARYVGHLAEGGGGKP